MSVTARVISLLTRQMHAPILAFMPRATHSYAFYYYFATPIPGRPWRRVRD